MGSGFSLVWPPVTAIERRRPEFGLNRAMKRFMYSAARILLAALVLVQVFLYAMQDRMIFLRQPLAEEMRGLVHKLRPDAEEVSGFALEANELPGVSFALFNYRGYGRSEGEPSEQALFSDSLAIYDAVAARP